MSGVTFASGERRGRRAVDSEINMVPMIDLMVCCISFLLISAVWTHMARLHADAEVPSLNHDELHVQPPEKVLHVEIGRGETFVLTWRQGQTVLRIVQVVRREASATEAGAHSARYPELASQISEEWALHGSHRDPSDKRWDLAAVHAENTAVFGDIAAVIDAIYAPKRRYGQGPSPVPAFNVAFATN